MSRSRYPRGAAVNQKKPINLREYGKRNLPRRLCADEGIVGEREGEGLTGV